MQFLCITHPPDVESLGVGLRNMQLNEHIQVLRPPTGFMLMQKPLCPSKGASNCSDSEVHLLCD